MRAITLLIFAALGIGAFEFRRVQDTAHREADMWSTIGEIRMKSGDDAGAREAFTKSLELEDRTHTYVLRSFANWRLMNYPACLDDMEVAFAREVENPAIRASYLSALKSFIR